MSSNNKSYEIGSFELTLMSAATGMVLLIVALLTAAFTELSLGLIALIFILVYAAFEIFICFLAYNSNKKDSIGQATNSLEHMISEAVRRIEFPTVITDRDGMIFWANKKMLELCGASNQRVLWNVNFSKFTGVNMSELIGKTDVIVNIAGKNFCAYPYLMEAPDRDYWLTTFADRSEVDELMRQIDDVSPVVAYISVDNLEDLMQYAQGSYRESAAAVEDRIVEWANSIGGMLREYERDKYILVFSKSRLAECVEGNFPILDRVREVTFGDGSMHVTVSLGVSYTGKDFAERSKNARTALDNALQRGGDQAALRNEGKLEYYGGKTKTNMKRTKIRSRVITEKLAEHVAAAGNVIVMGHKYPDFDSIGSCIGVARIALAYNPKVKIVIDSKNSNFERSTKQLLTSHPDYNDIFIDSERGLNMVRSDTLLIMCDVNNLEIVESPEIAAVVPNLIIIDHHRKAAEYENEPLIEFIQASASSASELVCEIIEMLNLGVGPKGIEPSKLSRHEANIMLAGMMLDTKNFTRSTSERTFSAAGFLRGVGADPEYVRTFFYADLDSFVTESKLGSEVRLYRERIALTVCEGNGTPDDRIAASKTADTLLTVQGIDAAFVLIRTDSAIAISARSNGSINVQLILEKLGGGGHFDSAGAQIKNTVSREVLEQLKTAIDSYLDDN